MRILGGILTAVSLISAVAVSQSSHFNNPAPVSLLTAGNFRFLAPTITIVAGDTVIGNVGGSTVTNNARVIGDVWATTYTGSGTISGTQHDNTDGIVTAAQTDLAAAYDTAVARITDTTLSVALDKDTLGCGVYASPTFSLNDTLVLDGRGDANAVFIFKVTGSTLITGTAGYVKLINGAVWSNVFWQVTSSATITGDFKGIVLALTSINQSADASSIVSSRLMARNGAITISGYTATQVKPSVSKTPREFVLNQNYPNPFNPSTKIQYAIVNAGLVSLKVYDLLGHEVATLVNEYQEAGSYTVPFGANTGTKLSSGVYFYRLNAGSFVSMRKMILLK
jgi:hypothetical protein